MIKYYILFLTIISLFFFACNQEEVNKVDPPAKVTLVSKSDDSVAVEKGIDAIYLDAQPDRNAIFLEWHPNQEKILAGYVIYRSEFSNRNYVNIARITKEFSIDTTFIDNSVSLLTRYYYFVRAFDDLDQYGQSSDTVNYSLVDHPVLSSPYGDIGGNQAPMFIWDFNPSFVPHYFVFRLDRKENQVFTSFYIQKLDLEMSSYDPHQEWRLNRLTGMDSLTSGEYRWRIDPVGSELNQGAESVWFVFVIQ